MDQFAAEGAESTVKELYADWLKKVDKLQRDSQDAVLRSVSASHAEAALRSVGFDATRVS